MDREALLNVGVQDLGCCIVATISGDVGPCYCAGSADICRS